MKQTKATAISQKYVNWREESIKTRIETHHRDNQIWYIHHIEEKNPLKQGLKLGTMLLSVALPWIEEKNPLKQGLKPFPRYENDTFLKLKRRIH